VLKTAWLVDTVGNRGAHNEIQAIKVATPRTVQWILDKAIQVQTLEALSEGRPLHVVGNSLGGAIAQCLLVSHPDRVASLSLISSVGFGSEISPLLRLLAVPVLGALGTRRPARRTATMIGACDPCR
jgi:pimeloyl-ACP methyl ester carboxylesterase